MKHRYFKTVFVVSLFLAASGAIYAVGGCNDSPEAPTDVLLIVGTAGMFYGSSLVAKMRSKRRGR